MIYWAEFEEKLLSDPKCTGPVLQTLSLNPLPSCKIRTRVVATLSQEPGNEVEVVVI